MVNIRAVNSRSLFLLLFLALVTPATAQNGDGPVQMTPDFAVNFPVTMMNKHDVTVKYPIMINPVTVLTPGMILRVIYMPPAQSDSENLALAHKGNMEESYSRDVGTAAEKEQMPHEMAHEIERQRRRVWEVPNNFLMAIAQYPTDTMHLIYSNGFTKDSGLFAKKENLTDTSFSFFDGLFVGMPNGKVTILGVEKGSHADQAGLKAGEEITAVGSVPVAGDLKKFAAAYAAAKKYAKDNDASDYPVTIRNSDGATHTIGVAMPLQIKSNLMDGFKD